MLRVYFLWKLDAETKTNINVKRIAVALIELDHHRLSD